ncbi:hypothetical protein [Thalassovita mediterranea]|jgi:hypothetical protein|uniref:Cytochrome C oxidase assembly protein n=1 Tax=Thalassovita mediterranea TaxID=340021 RepID=A0A0N7M1Q7_9RHOB|nr:hypothetical protein [Thalassovita mediterranea]CUH83979.1 hypothetical protein TM5383_01184 [Thalassovita mediterranea]SIS27980.1 hypothetical protein SAMN05421685_101329 [Thalassovita mediterranea]
MGFENVEHELHKRRSSRNIGVGLTLVAFIAIVFGLTMVKITSGGLEATISNATQGEG